MADTNTKLQAACTIEHGDTEGYAIVAGTLVTGVHIGRIFWHEVGEDSGLVMEIEGEECCPSGVDWVIAILADHGWQLTDDSLRDVESLIQ